MSLEIEIPPAMERRLQDVASRRGELPSDFARAAVAEKLDAAERDELERRKRLLAMLDRWDAEDRGRTDDLPAPEIPPLQLRSSGGA